MDETEIYKNLNVDIPEEEIESLFNNYLEDFYNPEKFYNDIKSQNKPTGVYIKESNNTYSVDPFECDLNNKNIVFNHQDNNITMDFIKNLDLNIEKYSIRDILHLFDFEPGILTKDDLKKAKKIVLKLHPDKSRLEPKYFLFYMKAYNHIEELYKCQKLSEKTYEDERDNIGEVNKKKYTNHILLQDTDDPFLNEYKKEMLQYTNVHKDEFCDYEDWLKKNNKLILWKEWRDNKFENNLSKNGYGDWLKSDEGLYEEKVITSLDEWNKTFEERRKEITTLSIHNEANKVYSNISRGSALIDVTNNFTKLNIPISDNNKLQYTDIKEAFTESICPVNTEDDLLDKREINLNYNELAEDVWNNKTQDISASLSSLYHENDDSNTISAALAYHYASKSVM
jgi:uncharacterized protein YueI